MIESLFIDANLTEAKMDSADTTDAQFQGAIGFKA